MADHLIGGREVYPVCEKIEFVCRGRVNVALLNGKVVWDKTVDTLTHHGERIVTLLNFIFNH